MASFAGLLDIFKKFWFKIFRKNTVSEYKLNKGNYSSFHNDSRIIFSIATIFGLFPVQNIYKKNISLLKTRLFSFIYIYSCIMLTGFITISIHGIQHILYHITFQIGELKSATAPLLFYGTQTIACYLFIDVAKKWPNIIRKWSKIEKEINYIRPPTTNKGLAALIMTLGLVEHLFHNWINTKNGTRLDEGPIANYLKTFCFATHLFLVDEHNYSHFKGVLIVIFSFNGTLLWTFIDVFIILVTSGLRGQLYAWNQFTYRQVLESDFCWLTFRRDYQKIIDFIKLVDKNLNKIIGLSVVNNFYFISTQLIEEVRMSHDKYSERMFFLFSFSFLVLRAVSSFMNSASVHDEWRRVSTPIHASQSQSPEVERILTEVHSDHVAMSAFNLFHITRGLLLAMFGVVLSYELLLVETHEAERLAALKNDANTTNATI